MRESARQRRIGQACAAAAAAVLLATCGSEGDNRQATAAAAQRVTEAPTGTSAAAEQNCAQVEVNRWIDVPTVAGEPAMRLPQPPNWEPESDFIKPPMKLVLRNNTLADSLGVPAITVATGEVIGPDKSASDALDDSIEGFENVGAQNITQRAIAVCGYSARRVTYTAESVSASVVAVAVPVKGTMSVVIVAAQSVTPLNPTFRADSELILSGMQIVS